MSDWVIGLSTGSFYRTSLFDCLPAVRDEGFELVELCTYPAHLDIHDQGQVEKASRTLARLGVRVASVHAPFGPHMDITAGDGTRETTLQEIRAAARAAAMVGARALVLHPGPDRERDSGPEDDGWIATSATAIAEIVRTCRELGVRVALENQLPHLLTGGPARLQSVLGRLPEDGLGICLDTGHAHLSRELLPTLENLVDRLEVIHVSDNHGLADDHLPPGEGGIDWDVVLAALHTTGYRGPLILELAGDGDPRLTLEAAVRGRTFLRDRMRALGPVPTSRKGDEAGFEILEHTADLGLRIRAPDLSGLFATATGALTGVMVENLDTLPEGETEPFTLELEAEDLPELLRSYLGEVLFLFETRRVVPRGVKASITGTRLRVTLGLETLDLTRHVLGNEVKAVTHHGLRVEKTDEGWLAELVLDI